MKLDTWYTAKVEKGKQHGREIGFPTVNLTIEENIALEEGVYAALVCHDHHVNEAALYYGPRLVRKETKPILEIHILDFDRNIYGEEVKYKIISFIRGKIAFKMMADLKKQITADIQAIKKILKNHEKRC